MTTPDEPGQGPEPPGQRWGWSIDPAPPAGPSQEPTPDADAGPSVDVPLEPTPPPAGERSAPAAPDWSTPETVAAAPPLSGNPEPPTGPPPGQTAWDNPPGPGQRQTPSGPGQDPPGRAGPEPPEEAGQRPASPRFAPPGDRRWWFVLGLVAALLSCCCVAATLLALTWGPDLFAGLRDRNQRVVGLDQPGRDGDLEFRVREVRCGLDQVGDPLVNQLAVGQFCVVELVVRNLGRDPVTFQDNLQTAYGPSGERFRVDNTASLLANSDQLTFLDEIEPGGRVTGAVVYDIPTDSQIRRLRLRQSAQSAGVLVRVG